MFNTESVLQFILDMCVSHSSFLNTLWRDISFVVSNYITVSDFIVCRLSIAAFKLKRHLYKRYAFWNNSIPNNA